MTPREELFQLLNLLAESQLPNSQHVRLNELLRSDDVLVNDYVQYMAIHGQFFWDAGLSATSTPSAETGITRPDRGKRRSAVGVAVAAALLIATVGVFARFGSQPEHVQPVAGNNPIAPASQGQATSVTDVGTDVAIVAPLQMINSSSPPVEKNVAVSPENPAPTDFLNCDFSDQQVVELIDELLQASWEQNSVVPSEPSSDYEWLRRVYLTFAGRIPTLEELDDFTSHSNELKYPELINTIVDDGERSSWMAVVWTNLLIGRTEKRGVNRRRLYDYLATTFRENRPWMQTVEELITASGRNDRNGATNFLLAHLNNEATPATAVTARLFLGQQINCVQCHDHPFAKEMKQQDYWSLNAFFKDTTQKSVPLAAKGNSGVNELAWTLADRSVDATEEDRMTYYASRSGLQNAVLPSYDGQTLAADSTENRRRQLARMLTTDSNHRVAAAMVNRMWAHFFGYGFTAEVDDMGLHSPVSHPELLRLLTEAFVKSNYDVKRLMSWIGQTKAWRLGSSLTAGNVADQPDAGDTPLFNRVYIRRMTPEQVYESIRVAIRSAAGQPVPAAAEYSTHRREWVSQFARPFNTDENDESMNFDGTIAQAMAMMNGAEVDDAIQKASQSVVGNRRPRRNLDESLSRVARAMLTRESTDAEEKAFRSNYTPLSQKTPTSALSAALGDLMWAYLNSSEFQLVH